MTLDQQAVGRLARMDLMQRQQMAKETQRRRQVEPARIDAALERIRTDEFGWCAKCGEEISAARLEFDPTVPLCIDCASSVRSGAPA
ncbi:MAG: TraR/DksA C4-type zinc finger protein [Pseudomonadota bacterium]